MTKIPINRPIFERDNARQRALIAELVGALEAAEASLVYWGKMGVNIDCSSWSSLTKVRAAIAKAKRVLSNPHGYSPPEGEYNGEESA